MVADMLAALVSTIMLAIGDIYGIPYLYLPWLINTIEGIAFYEGPALFGLAYNVLSNASISAGLFIFITLLLYGKNVLKKICNILISESFVDDGKELFNSNSSDNL